MGVKIGLEPMPRFIHTGGTRKSFIKWWTWG